MVTSDHAKIIIIVIIITIIITIIIIIIIIIIINNNNNCWFSHGVTKIQTEKLWILPNFYFHDALEQLKTNFHTNFWFKRALGFVIEYA